MPIELERSAFFYQYRLYFSVFHFMKIFMKFKGFVFKTICFLFCIFVINCFILLFTPTDVCDDFIL